jgi:UDP:flavonoid glycosyltransferase YjiC (YdhE family)
MLMRFLIVPGNNSLSHIFKCLSVTDSLTARGHEVIIAVCRDRVKFLVHLGYKHYVLPDLQESDGSGLPTIEWFRRPKYIEECIRAEIDLINKEMPDRVLGIFRFTLKVSSKFAGVPFDSLVCGCMIPDTEEVLGFAEGEPGIEDQKMNLITFYRYAGARVSKVISTMGLGKVEDMRHLLIGDRTFLWDFPEFMAVKEKPDLIHVGPIYSDHMPRDNVNVEKLADAGLPLAVVVFGTCTSERTVAERITRILINSGYHVIVAAGGQKEMLEVLPDHPRVTVSHFAPLDKIFPYTSLVVTHGGQMTVFESLQQKIPVVVMPFQPEQAHNGVCLERIECGCRLIPPVPFRGDSEVYIDALNRMTDKEIMEKVNDLVNRKKTLRKLEEISEIITMYNGVDGLSSKLEEG